MNQHYLKVTCQVLMVLQLLLGLYSCLAILTLILITLFALITWKAGAFSELF